jgi:hypothetical protein
VSAPAKAWVALPSGHMVVLAQPERFLAELRALVGPMVGAP